MCTFNTGVKEAWDPSGNLSERCKTVVYAQKGAIPGAIPYGFGRRRGLCLFHLLKVLSRLLTPEKLLPVIPCFIGVLRGFGRE